MKEFEEFEWFEWFEWFGPSPIEPFNSGGDGKVVAVEAVAEVPDELLTWGVLPL